MGYAGTTHLSIVIASDMVHSRMSSATRGNIDATINVV